MSGPRRGVRAALLALLAAAAWAPAAGAQMTRPQVIEVLRPVAGRPSEVIVTGRVRHVAFDKVDSLEVDLPRRQVVVRAISVDSGTAAERSYAFSLSLPPLPEGSYDLILFLRPALGDGETFSHLNSFPVHPSPATVEVQQDEMGLSRVRIKGAASLAALAGAPYLDGKTIRVPISLGCDNDCGGAFFGEGPAGASPWDFDLLSEPIGPLPAGRYTLEVVREPAVFDQAKLVWREEVDLLRGPVALRDGRFGVAIELDGPATAAPGLVQAPSADAALFYFFDPDNWEAMVKVLDGCGLNGHFWVFAAASTDVGYTLRITDRESGATREYRHDAGTPAPAVTDIAAFACGGGG